MNVLCAACRITVLALCLLLPWRMAQAQFITTEVPFVPTPANVVDAMLQMALVNRNDYLLDLGSGDGRIVIEAARKYGARGMGVELDSNLVFLANEEVKRQRLAPQVSFVQGNLLDADISRATVLTLYLSRQINLRLRPRILTQLRPGTRVVAHDFDMGEWKPDQHREISVPDKSYGPPVSQVYLWYVPANVAGKWRWQLAIEGRTHDYEVAFSQSFQELWGEALVDGGTARGPGASLRGDLITFALTREYFGQQMRHEFSGRIEGDKAIGRARISVGGKDIALNWEAARVERGKMQIE